MPKIKLGRPRNDNPTQRTEKISFRVDEETLNMLKTLEGALSASFYGRRSAVLRDSIHEKFEREFPGHTKEKT